MSVLVTANLTLIDDADTATGWVGTSGGLDDEVYIQGGGTPGSYTYQSSKSARTSATFTPAANINMTSPGYGDIHIYFWMRCDVFPFSENKTTGTGAASGLTFRLTDGSAAYIEWHIAGADTWNGGWKCFVVDVQNTSQIYASSGTLDLTDIDILTWYVDISNSGNIRIIDNTWLDVVRFGEGLTATGTTFDLAGIAADDDLLANKYGILENIDGVIFCQGKLTIGSGATTTTFDSTDEVLVYRDRVGTGIGGMVDTDLYELAFAGSGCVADINGLVAKGAGTTDVTRFLLDASDTNADVTIDGSTFIRAGLVEFVASSDIQNSVFNNCFQITPSTGVFKYNTISNYVGTAGGAVLFPTSYSNINNLTFANCDYAIECATAQTYGFTDINISGSNDADINNSSAATTLGDSEAGSTDVLMRGSSNQGVAQEFTGTATKLSNATFKLSKTGSPTGNIVAELYDSDDGAPAEPTGSVLATSNILAATDLDGTPTLYYFEFEDEYTMSAQTYFIALKFTGGSVGNTVDIVTDNTGAEIDLDYAVTDDHSSWAGTDAVDAWNSVRSGGIVKINATDSTVTSADQTDALPGATIISASVTVTVQGVKSNALQFTHGAISGGDSAFNRGNYIKQTTSDAIGWIISPIDSTHTVLQIVSGTFNATDVLTEYTDEACTDATGDSATPSLVATEYASCRIEKTSDGETILNALASTSYGSDGFYKATDSWKYPGSETAVTISARYTGYKPFVANGIITSSGLTVTAVWIPDPNYIA
jgi:hypothetical protein